MDEAQFHNLVFMVGEVLHKQEDLKAEVAKMMGLQVPANEAILQMSARRRTSHKLLESKRLIVEFLAETERDECPCCRKDLPIMDAGKLVPGTEFDHWRGPHDNSIGNLWPVHGSCHVKLHSRIQVRDAYRARFESFQMDLADWMEGRVPYGKVGPNGQTPLFDVLPVWTRPK